MIQVKWYRGIAIKDKEMADRLKTGRLLTEEEQSRGLFPLPDKESKGDDTAKA